MIFKESKSRYCHSGVVISNVVVVGVAIVVLKNLNRGYNLLNITGATTWPRAKSLKAFWQNYAPLLTWGKKPAKPVGLMFLAHLAQSAKVKFCGTGMFVVRRLCVHASVVCPASIISLNRKAQTFDIWHVASPNGPVPSLFKLWPPCPKWPHPWVYQGELLWSLNVRRLSCIFVVRRQQFCCYNSTGHNFDPIFLKLAHNVYLDNISDKFEYGWGWVKK